MNILGTETSPEDPVYTNITDVCNFYVNYHNGKEGEQTTTTTSPKKSHSFDDDSVLKFYENIPTSPVHDDKIIESLYENIDQDMEKLEKIPYHKLYENIEKSKDFPYQVPNCAGLDEQKDSELINEREEEEDVEERVLSDDLYSDITDIRFSGPAELMSTSFSDAHNSDQEQEWDSGSESRSSSSGEFVWKVRYSGTHSKLEFNFSFFY